MKNVFTFLLLFVSTSSMFAQNDVEQLPLIHPKNPEIVFEKLVASDKSGFYALFNNKKLKSYCIEKFDFQGKSMFSTNFKGDPEFEQIGEKSIYIFSSEFDKDDGKKGKLYLTEINAENGAKVGAKLISQLEILKKHDYEHFFSLSPDKTKLLVVSRFFCLSEELNEKTMFRFFDVNGMKQIWEKEIDSKVGDYFIKSSEYVTNNDGDVFLNYVSGFDVIGVKSSDALLETYGKGKSIAMIYAKEKKIEPFNFDFGEKLIVTSYLAQMDNNSKLFLYGMMRYWEVDKSRESGTVCKGGVVCMSVDVKTRKALSTKINRYDPVLHNKMTNKYRGAGDIIFKVNQILELDGSLYLVSHQTSTYSNTVYISTSLESKLLGYILVTKINPSTGVAEWSKVIPKNTSTKNVSTRQAYVINYHAFVASNKLHFVFLDHPRNFSKYQIDDDNVLSSDIGFIENVDKSNAVLVSFDQKGKGTKKVIFENTDNCVLPQMESIVFDKKSLLLYLNKGKENRFGLITP